MKDFPIPVRSIGPGSQPTDEDELALLNMPRDMATFEMPRVPERVDPAVLSQARGLLSRWLEALQRWDPAAVAHGPVLELAGTPPEVLAVINELMGEGEVAIRVTTAPELRIQEAVFSGLWRCLALDAQGQVTRDWLEAGPVPQEVLARVAATVSDELQPVQPPAGAMNSPALLAELNARLAQFQPGDKAGLINLTLLPMTPEDHKVLEQALPIGPVAMISRGFGNCHVTSTGTRHAWRVQYFNSMQTLILNTLEIVELPEAAIAAPEDLVDSRERLAELVQWMAEDGATSMTN